MKSKCPPYRTSVSFTFVESSCYLRLSNESVVDISNSPSVTPSINIIPGDTEPGQEQAAGSNSALQGVKLDTSTLSALR